MDTHVKYAIEIVDRWSTGLQKMSSAIDRVNVKKINDPFADQNKSLAQLRGNIERYRIAAENSFRTDHIRKYNQLISETEARIKKLQVETSTCSEKTSLWGAAIKKVAWAYAAMVAGKAFGGIVSGSITATSEMEKYNVALKTMMGNQGAARDRMSEYVDIAAKTPLQLNQVVDAGNQLQAMGRYSRENIVNLGDLAAASGKPIEQVLSAYSKLATGQKGEAVNMFRDLLISSEDWAKATGMGIKSNGELMASTEEMIAALPNILKAKGFIGMMEEQSKTTAGRISNLKDSFFQLQSAMGERLKPAFDSLIQAGSGLIDMTKKWVEIPVTVKIAEEKAELNALVGIITDANTAEETRRDLIADLQRQYPDFLGNLNAETVSNEQLRYKLAAVNEQYDRKIRLVAQQKITSDAESQYKETQARIIEVQTAIDAKKEIDKMWPSVVANYNMVYNYKKGDYGYLNTDVITERAVTEVENAIKFMLAPQEGMQFDYTRQIELFSDYIAYANNYLENKSTWSSLDSELAKLNVQSLSQKKVLGMYQNKLSNAEREEIYGAASLIDISNSQSFEKIFGKSDYKQSKALSAEFDALRKKSSEAYTDADWQRLSAFMSGDLRYSPSGGGGGGGNGPSGNNSFAKAEDAIAGGGRNVKNFNITIDNLVGVNNNIFEPGESIENAENFRNRLTALLQSVLNDINYSAN